MAYGTSSIKYERWTLDKLGPLSTAAEVGISVSIHKRNLQWHLDAFVQLAFQGWSHDEARFSSQSLAVLAESELEVGDELDDERLDFVYPGLLDQLFYDCA